MKIIETPLEMQEWALKRREHEEKIALVPTMGALHEGHLSLLREGKRLADHLVLSIFVNPLQFGPAEDLKQYPKTLEKDLNRAEECGVDIVFYPKTGDMYPKDFQTSLDLGALSKPLCGAARPGHFQGVATVVLKLFNIVQPNVALFGQKDYQQLRIIQQMVKDLNLPVEIKPMPIVREDDGLAMSSRNRYLKTDERQAALAISLSLVKAQSLVDQGEKNVEALVKTVHATLEETKKLKVEYALLCDPKTLDPLKTLKLPALLAVACRIGETRLIDNCVLR
ncbi:MAG: pantoate--beta-alanine ligase [Deltaproteobacteria bacterium]|nr:pantoate--beta-alanine ligase [Deltaproteobacteria bacterium]